MPSAEMDMVLHLPTLENDSCVGRLAKVDRGWHTFDPIARLRAPCRQSSSNDEC